MSSTVWFLVVILYAVSSLCFLSLVCGSTFGETLGTELKSLPNFTKVYPVIDSMDWLTLLHHTRLVYVHIVFAYPGRI